MQIYIWYQHLHMAIILNKNIPCFTHKDNYKKWNDLTQKYSSSKLFENDKDNKNILKDKIIFSSKDYYIVPHSEPISLSSFPMIDNHITLSANNDTIAKSNKVNTKINLRTNPINYPINWINNILNDEVCVYNAKTNEFISNYSRKDIELVVEQVCEEFCDFEYAIKLLIKNDGDIVNAIMEGTM